MKKIYSIILAAAAIFAASSCQEEIVEPDLGTQENESMTIIAGFGAETKTVLDGLKTYWTEGDQISVFDSNKKEYDTDEGNNRCFSIDETATNFEDGKAASAIFKYDGEFVWPQNNQPDPLVVALYPYQENAYCDFFYYDRNYITGLNIPVEQVALEGGFDANATFALATSKYSESDNLTFTNLYSLLRITINEDDVKEVKVSVEGGKIAGEAKVQLNLEMEDENTPVFNGGTLSATENGANTVTLTCEDGFVAGKDYYIAIAPVTYTNIKVYLDDVIVKDTTPEGGKTLEANTVYNISNLDDPHTVADGVYLNDEGVYEISNVDGLKWLSGQTDGKVTKVKIVEDIEFSEEFWVKQNLTIDLGEKTLTGTASRFIRVASDTDETIEVTIKNGEVLNNKNGGRCIETRSGNVTLNLEGVTLSTPSNGANQPLTIGGSGDNITVNIENSTITTNNVSGYAITTFNPVTMTITESEVSGWCALNIKPASSSEGSDGSQFNVIKSTLTGTNAVPEGNSNSFTTIMIEDKNVTVNIDSESTVKAESTNSNFAFIVGLGSDGMTDEHNAGITGTKVTLAGNLVLEGDNTRYFNPYKVNIEGNTVKFPESVVDNLKAEGWNVSEPDNGLVTIIPEPVKSERNLAFTQESGTATYGDEFTLPQLTGEGDLTKAVYAVTDGEAATVTDGGVVTLVKAGTVTIKATVAEDDTHLAGEATYTLTVNSPEAWGICGSFNSWTSGSATSLTYVGDGWYQATEVEIYKDDSFKFIKNNSWDDALGKAVTANDDEEIELEEDGYEDNIKVAKNGKFTVRLNPLTKKFTVKCTEEYTSLKVKITITDNRNWGSVNLHLWEEKGDTDINITSWPGVSLTKQSSGKYEYELDGKYIGIELGYILNDGSGNQTSDAWFTPSHNGNEMIIEALPDPTVTYDLYLNVSNWGYGDARYAAYFYIDDNNEWVSMTKISDTIYGVNIPTTNSYKHVIFVRMNGVTSDNSWDNKWNQTGDLTIPTDGKNLFTMTSWDGQTSGWSVKQ